MLGVLAFALAGPFQVPAGPPPPPPDLVEHTPVSAELDSKGKWVFTWINGEPSYPSVITRNGSQVAVLDPGITTWNSGYASGNFEIRHDNGVYQSDWVSLFL